MTGERDMIAAATIEVSEPLSQQHLHAAGASLGAIHAAGMACPPGAAPRRAIGQPLPHPHPTNSIHPQPPHMRPSSARSLSDVSHLSP